MMMRCIALSSSLKIVFDPQLDVWTDTFHAQDYHPNPNGFFQSNDWDVDLPYFYDAYKGRLIKILRASLHLLPHGKYRLVFMTRNPSEIRASMRKFGVQACGSARTHTFLYDEILGATLRQLEARGDFEILKVHYPDVIANPEREFKRVRDFGFPIDPKKASSLVDESLYRLRLEDDANIRP
jgi:hypothetical protein